MTNKSLILKEKLLKELASEIDCEIRNAIEMGEKTQQGHLYKIKVLLRLKDQLEADKFDASRDEVNKVYGVDAEIKDLLEQGIYFDGAQHKQWCLVQIAKRLGVELEEGNHEEGIAP